MSFLTIRVDKPATIQVPTFTATAMRQIGAQALAVLHQRVAAHKNLNDVAAKAYSSRGPIYIPVYGVGTITRGATTVARTKTGLHGAYGLTGKDLKKMGLPFPKAISKNVGTMAHFAEQNRRAAQVILSNPSGHIPLQVEWARGVIRNHRRENARFGAPKGARKTVRFENWAAFKRAIGKTGERDLELTGRMLGSIGVVAVTDNTITICFTREEEHLKAKGNQNRDPWFGLSSSDKRAVEEFAFRLLRTRIAAD